jgi:hypothetical protein
MSKTGVMILMAQTSRLEQAIESVEALSSEEQETLINVVKRRLIERRRDQIASNIAQSQLEYDSGKVFRGTIDQIIDEIGA